MSDPNSSRAATVRRWFASDNNATVHPRILEALAGANNGHAVGYGDDPLTSRAEALLAARFGTGALVRFVLNGTGANVYALGCFAGQGDAVLCSDCAHILVDETGAPTAVTGAQLVSLPTHNGKVDPEGVRHMVADYADTHKPRPVLLSLSQPTELGTVYTREELAALIASAHEAGLLVHIDGARLSNAAAALDCSLAEAAGSGADVVCVGGTKNGLMFGEAVVFTPGCASTLPDTARLRKTRLQLASKMRFIAAQFEAWLADDLWRVNALQANRMARRLAEAAGQLGLAPRYPVDTNALFVRLPEGAAELLRKEHFFYDWEGGLVRWMTSWDTTSEDVDSFADTLRGVLASLPRTAATFGLPAFDDEALRGLLRQKRRLLRSDWDELSRYPSPQQRGLPVPPVLADSPAGSRRIALPEAKKSGLGQRSYTEVTEERRSHRKFKPGPISLEELSYLLWATAGSRRPPFRTVPSGGCRHPLDLLVYVRQVEGLEAGIYRYDSVGNQIVFERPAQLVAGAETAEPGPALDADFDAALHGQLWNCAALFVWAAVPFRTEWRYTVAASKLVLLDAGHACQALYSACAALGLGCCAVGAYDQDRLDALLGLDGVEQLTVYAAPAGRV